MVNYEQAYKNVLAAVVAQGEKYRDKCAKYEKLDDNCTWEERRDFEMAIEKLRTYSHLGCFMTEQLSSKPYRELEEVEERMIRELYSCYESWWNRAKYEKCDAMIDVLSIINKHLTGHTGWRIDYEGSIARDLLNPRMERKDEEG